MINTIANIIPVDAYDLHIFAIKEVSTDLGTYTAFIGYNIIPDGDFHFVQLPIDNSIIKSFIEKTLS